MRHRSHPRREPVDCLQGILVVISHTVRIVVSVEAEMHSPPERGACSNRPVRSLAVSIPVVYTKRAAVMGDVFGAGRGPHGYRKGVTS